MRAAQPRATGGERWGDSFADVITAFAEIVRGQSVPIQCAHPTLLRSGPFPTVAILLQIGDAVHDAANGVANRLRFARCRSLRHILGTAALTCRPLISFCSLIVRFVIKESIGKKGTNHVSPFRVAVVPAMWSDLGGGCRGWSVCSTKCRECERCCEGSCM